MSTYLCPAPTPTGRKCLVRIPCEEHAVSTHLVGAMTYGDEILEIRPRPAADPVDVPEWALDPGRLFRLGLYALTCASIVYSVGDAAFTGRSILAIVLTLTTAGVVLGRLGRQAGKA